MEMIIILALLIILLAIWVISTRRKLVIMDENVNNAMGQIGVQLSSGFDALMALLDLAKGTSIQETVLLMEKVKSRRRIIVAKSTPGDVLGQETIISETLDCVALLVEQYPKLKMDINYEKYMSAVESYEKMLRTSYLIYNDSVTKFNRAVRTFPTNFIAGMLGFRQHDYIELAECKRNK